MTATHPEFGQTHYPKNRKWLPVDGSVDVRSITVTPAELEQLRADGYLVVVDGNPQPEEAPQ